MNGNELFKRIETAVNEVFTGKEEVVRKLLICLFAGGHVLLEDVPGVGKTTLARTLAGACGATMGRVQFTPDTLPSDITGISVFNQKTGEFDFRSGVVMNQVLLADEINRTTPKTQSALLEAMSEGKVTVDGNCYELPKPFMVIATQNPVSFVGTYPLPEAQLDRFMMKLSIGYPDTEKEILMARKHLSGETPDKVRKVCTPEDVLSLMKEIENVKVGNECLSYAEDLINLTREERRFVIGLSPRALIALLKAARVKAAIDGRDFVKPDDIKEIAPEVLAHRLNLAKDARIAGEDTTAILRSLIIKARVPVIKRND